LSLDRQKPGTLAVATMNRWSPVDTVWRSTDGGATWKDIADNATRDVNATPFLLWGQPQAKLGWWMAALAIDPFDSDHAAYATGATIYATREFAKVSAGQPTRWATWVEGIEQTAVLCLLSPTSGAHLISGFGDIGGFVHEDLNVSPPGACTRTRSSRQRTASTAPKAIQRDRPQRQHGREAVAAFLLRQRRPIVATAPPPAATRASAVVACRRSPFRPTERRSSS
jgi:hypothetical protein